jgi:hypothetical protein
VDVDIHITHDLQAHLNLPDTLTVQGNTVGDCLEQLFLRFPQLRGWFDDQDGLLRKFILLNHDVTLAPTPINFARQLRSGDRLTIMAVYAGG